MSYNDILKRIEKAIEEFNKKIPASQRSMLDEITLEIKRLDLNGQNIKSTVANLRIINSIKNKLNRLILTDDYKAEVKKFATAFNDVTKLQNEYWVSVEQTFKPRPLLKEVRVQAIQDTVNALTEQGIVSTISEQIIQVLKTNITAGGTYKQLQNQLRDLLVDTPTTDGALTRYAKQITVDSINQYNAQYTQIVSSDLGFTWFAYQGTEITTSRPFCQAMVENNRYFHISQVPNLLKGLDVDGNKLKYEDNKGGGEKSVELYAKTGLPSGFIEGTTPENFFIRRGGYQCGHQARPVSERLVRQQSPETYERVINSQVYKAWQRTQSSK